jgi:formylglycine-generating enzyme required for sulfatase activity
VAKPGSEAVSPAAAAEDPDAAPGEAAAPPAPAPTLPDGTAIAPCLDSAPAGLACVPGGRFVRGADDGPKNAAPQQEIWLQTFYMDTHEVTYAQYKACEKARDCPRSGPRYTDFDHPDMPIQGVSWFHARDYCAVQGKQLPTEAQWEKAARGPDGELYPWGNEPSTCERAIIRDASGRSCGLKKAISKPETGRPWDVGSRPVGRYGLYDMMGNSWEWVADWYSRSYEECGEACTGTDPKGPCDGADPCPGHAFKLVRGGSWYWDADRATSTWRRPHHADNEPFHHFGFRCAATVAQVEALANASVGDGGAGSGVDVGAGADP